MSIARLVVLLAAVATATELAPFSAAQAADTTPPTLEWGEIDDGTVTLIFSEAMDPSSVGGSFWLNVWTSPHAHVGFLATGDVEVSGHVVTVGVGEGQARAKPGLSGNQFTYLTTTDPDTKRLRDLAGNPVRTPYSYFGGQQRTRTIALDNVTEVVLTVTGVAVSSRAGADRTYAKGETIGVRLTFSKRVTVSGTPRVKLDFSSGAGDEKWADYAGGSGTKTLDFAYKVGDRDSSTAGIAVLANTLELNGGTIESASTAGENATLAHAGLAHDPAHTVDGTVAVSGVALSSDAGADDTYVLGETVRVTLTFSDAVNVTGVPRVKVDLGSGAGDEKWADYERGGGTTKLVFAYEVASGDASSAGVAVLANMLEINGGTIKSATGARESARLAHAGLDHDPSHKVDGTTPTLSAAAVDGATLTLTFNEPLGAAASLVNGVFTVEKTHGGVEQNVVLSGSPAISGATVTLTLTNAVLTADTGVKVSYTRPTSGTGNRLRDQAGNEVVSFTAQPVTNRTRVAVSGVEVSSNPRSDDAYGLDETIQVRVAFSEAVEVTGTPRVKIDFSAGGGDERWADYASGSGTTMLAFAYAVAQGDASGAGVAVLANTLALNGGTIPEPHLVVGPREVHALAAHPARARIALRAPQYHLKRTK